MIGSLGPRTLVTMDVGLVWEAFLSSLLPFQGGVALSVLYIGIDVSKDFSTAQAIDGNGNKCFYLEFAMTADGFSQLFKAIRVYA
jgi:hypothetical protein